MSTAGAFSGLVRAPLSWHAGLMKSGPANVDRRPQQVFILVFLLMWGMMALVLCAQSLHLRAATRAIVLSADGLSIGQYRFAYTIAGQTCRQTVDQEPPLPKPGTEIEIHYDPNNICDNATYNPLLIGLFLGLPWTLGVLAFLAWVWPRKGPK